MQLVIDIPENTYKQIQALARNNYFEHDICGNSMRRIANGTTLPKGHGDLIDVNRKITVPVYDEQYEEWGEKILTVREALNRWSEEGITIKDVVILSDKSESEETDKDMEKEE